MYHPSRELPEEQKPNMRGGDGTVTLAPAFTSGDYAAPVRLFSRITLPVGASIGYHIHEQEEEFFYFLSGTGIMDDNGIPVTVKAGDSTVTRSGEGHSLRNTGDSPLELLAVIAYT